MIAGEVIRRKEMRGAKEIKIYGFHHGEDKNIMKIFINKGFNSRIVRGGIVIDFKKVDLFELIEIKKRFRKEEPEDPGRFGWNQDFSRNALCFIRTTEDKSQPGKEIKEKFNFSIESSKWIYIKVSCHDDGYTTQLTLEETKLEPQNVPITIREYIEWYRNKEIAESEAIEKPKFLIPNSDSIRMQPRMALVEEGGATKRGGSATIICGIKGQPLHSYWVFKNSGPSNGIHAHFSVSHNVILIKAIQDCHGEKIFLTQCFIARNGNRCWVEKRQLWDGQFNKLPKKLNQFYVASKLAMKKSYDHHCRKAYYII